VRERVRRQKEMVGGRDGGFSSGVRAWFLMHGKAEEGIFFG